MKRTWMVGRMLAVLLMAAAVGWPAASIAKEAVLMMATTTSTDNTGLLDYLAPHFIEDTGIAMRWTATGTGKALELGRNCDVDVLLVHAPAAEIAFVEAGYGTNRRPVMYNDFVIIGPAADPTGIKGQGVAAAITAFVEHKAAFVSRGDDSGTHQKELSLWPRADRAVPERETWYIQAGQGMLATINIAAERRGYTMTDRGTFIKYAHGHGGNPPLVILVEGDAALRNPYAVITVNPARCADGKSALADRFGQWMAGPRGQQLIADFKLMDQTLFFPDAR